MPAVWRDGLEPGSVGQGVVREPTRRWNTQDDERFNRRQTPSWSYLAGSAALAGVACAKQRRGPQPRLRTAQAQGFGRLLAWDIFKDIFQEKKKVERNPTALHDKNTQQKGIKGNFLTRMKGIYRKSQRTSDSVNGERLNALSLRSGTRQECLLWPLLFNILQVLADRQVKERKGLQIGERESVPSFRSARVGATRGRAGIRSWRHSSRVCSKCLSQPTCPGNQDQSELQK